MGGGSYFRAGGVGPVTFGIQKESENLALLSGSRYFRGGPLLSEFYGTSSLQAFF